MGTVPGFVGRRNELAILERLLTDAEVGVGGVALVAGESGIGKSHLLAEVAERAARRKIRVTWGRCREGLTAPPLWPWLGVLRQLGQRDVLKVAATGGAPARYAQFEAVALALESAASESPLLVLVDDLHRGDEASLRLLAFLADRLWPGSISLLAALRDGEVRPGSVVASVLSDLAARPGCGRVDLRGLGLAEVEAWMAEVLGVGDPALAALVHDRTGGNPLFVGEVARRVQEGAPADGVPPTVRSLIAERVSALPSPTREVVQLAAIVGREFDYPVIAAALRTSPVAVLDALEPAIAALLVAPVGEAGRYRFSHALVADAVEDLLPRARRAEMHARVHGALRDSGWWIASDIAHHALRGRAVLGDVVVIDALWAAAEEADHHLAWEDAARWWDRLIELAGPTAALELRSGRSLLLAAQVPAARARFESAAAHAARDDDGPVLAAAALAVGETVAEVEADPGLISLLDRALTWPGLPAACRAQLSARRAIAGYWMSDDRADARQRAAIALADAQSSGDARAIGDALVAGQFTLRGPDLLDERLRAGEDALVIAGQLGDDELRFRAYQWLVPDRFQAGDIVGATEAVSAMATLAGQRRNPLMSWWVLVNRGLLAGFHEADETEELVDEAYRLGRRLGLDASEPYRLGQLSRLWWRTARLPSLIEELRSAVHRFPGLPTLQCDLALALAAGGDLKASTTQCRRLCANSFAALPRDSLYLASLAILAEAVVACRRYDLAPALATALEPYAEVNLIQGVPVGWGAAAWHLARLDLMVGDDAAASRHAGLADTLHERWGARGFGSPLDDMARLSIGLSPREIEVLRLVAAGCANKEIATQLCVSVHTVERHVSNIFLKTGVRNRAEATSWAHREGMMR